MDWDLNTLKKEYKKIQSRYTLPEFQELNENFSVEKIADYETDILIREIRRFISDKFSNYIKIIENILNPVSAPLFVFSVNNSLSEQEKKRLTKIYEILAKLEIKMVNLDLEFSEKKEADFIKNSFKMWKEIRKDLLKITSKIIENFDNEAELKKSDYLG